jgi:hypothetical protein
MRAFEPKELWQLCARYKQSDTALETDQDAFRNEVHDHACLGQPGNESEHADNQCRA